VRARRTSLADALLLATVFSVTFAKVRWDIGGENIYLAEVIAIPYVCVFALDRVLRRDWSFPRTAGVLAAFFAAFALVYLLGFYGLQTTQDLNLFAKGMAKFVIHFAFLVAAVSHLARRAPAFYWRTLGAFVAGVAVNAVYGVLQLAYAETAGGNLDELVLSPIGSYQRGGINVFGSVEGADVYRTNALTLDPNHLGIMLLIPLLVLLPLYLRLERGNRLRTPLALLLAFFFLVQLSTLSRSGLLGLVVGLLVLALPYRRLLVTPRLLVPLAAVAGVVALVVAQRTDFFTRVFAARTSLEGGSVAVHLDFYRLLPPVLDANPLFGLGLNTFSSYYEFVTGLSNWGPHSYYVAVLTETGIVGAALFLAYLGYLFRRLGALRELGRALARARDPLAARVRPLAWGLTAALTGTLVANAFYLTLQMYYVIVFAALCFAAPLVFRRALPA
jgi:O-antigen ligase